MLDYPTQSFSALTNLDEKLYPLDSATALLSTSYHITIRPVTLRKYCLAGRYGRKFGDRWFLSLAEIQAIAALSLEAHKPGRRKTALARRETTQGASQSAMAPGVTEACGAAEREDQGNPHPEDIVAEFNRIFSPTQFKIFAQEDGASGSTLSAYYMAAIEWYYKAVEEDSGKAEVALEWIKRARGNLEGLERIRSQPAYLSFTEPMMKAVDRVNQFLTAIGFAKIADAIEKVAREH